MMIIYVEVPNYFLVRCFCYTTHCVSWGADAFLAILQSNTGSIVCTRRGITKVAFTLWPKESVWTQTAIAVDQVLGIEKTKW